MTRSNLLTLIFISFILTACSDGDTNTPSTEVGPSTEVDSSTEVGPSAEVGGGDTNTPSVEKEEEEEEVNVMFAKLKPYQSSIYGQFLNGCVTVTETNDSCTMNKLPLIGQTTLNPSDNDILDRLTVSHTWMGDNFKQALSRMPSDMRLLFRSVTAIVIDEAIRPSYYYGLTGAIYLDPSSLWLTNVQKEDILKDEDYRSNFSDRLSFKEFNLYTRDGVRAFDTSGTINNSIERTIDNLVSTLSPLLFHELAHANDFASIQYMTYFDKADSIYEAIDKNLESGNLISQKLSPLLSQELISLGNVRFRGKTPTQAEKDMQPDYVSALFSTEGAITHYNYSTAHEDIANLFEAGMMKFHFNIDSDQAFVSYPTDETNAVCADYIVGGGSRNKIANPLAINRMLTVFEYIFPDRSYRPRVQSWIGVETPKRPGIDWCENLTTTPSFVRRGFAATISVAVPSFNPNILTASPNHSPSRRAKD